MKLNKPLHKNKPESYQGSYFWFMFQLILVILLSIWGWTESHKDSVNGVDIEGNYLVHKQSIYDRILESNLFHQSDISSYMQHIVESIPYVSNMAIRKTPGNRFEVIVEEYRPIAIFCDMVPPRMFTNKHTLVHLDTHDYNSYTDVPLVRGNYGEDFFENDTHHQYIALKLFLDALQSYPLSMTYISEVSWHKDEGIIGMALGGNPILVFGPSDFAEKLNNLETLISKPDYLMTLYDEHTLDLRYRNQIIIH